MTSVRDGRPTLFTFVFTRCPGVCSPFLASWRTADESLAAQLAALLSERDLLRSARDPDMRTRLELLRGEVRSADPGALARVRDGDVIRLDSVAGTLEVKVSGEDWKRREPVRPDLQANGHGHGRELFAMFRASATDAGPATGNT